MKKIISLLSALAIFSSIAVTGFAAGANANAAANSQPKIQGYVETVDGDGYAIIKFKLINNEELSYSLNRGKVTSNGINAIEVNLTLDEKVFDVSESYISGGFTGVNVSGDNGSKKTFVFAPTSVDSYMTTVPEYLFQVDALLKDGYTLDNIPTDAITIGKCQVEYTSYANVATSSGATTYTIYNINNPQANDYDLAVKFTGASTEWPEEGGEGGEDDDTATAMADGVPVTKGVYAGKTSASTDVVATKDLVKVVISNDVDTSKTLEWEAPKTYGEGKQNVLAVLLYDANVMKNSTFTVKFLGEAGAVIKTFTHKVQ